MYVSSWELLVEYLPISTVLYISVKKKKKKEYFFRESWLLKYRIT